MESTVAVPLESPKHNASVATAENQSGVGSVIVPLAVSEQPRLSVTVTTNVPDDNPLMLDVVAPLLHL